MYFYGKSHLVAESGPLTARFAYSLTKSGVRMRHVTPKRLADFYGHWCLLHCYKGEKKLYIIQCKMTKNCLPCPKLHQIG